jgi:glycine cleavage system H protein
MTKGSGSMEKRYTQDHEWIMMDGDEAIVGITDYAQHQLGDVVFVELPEIGKSFGKGDEIAVVESVKAASEIYAPIGGEIIATNLALESSPSHVNEQPEDGGWFVRIKPSNVNDLQHLMDEEAYQNFLETIQ